MKPRPFLAAAVLSLLTVLPFQAVEQYAALIDSAYNRSPDFHPSLTEVFRFDAIKNNRGVLSQASRLIAESGTAAPFSISPIIESDGYPGYIMVEHGNADGQYPIEYADLVPMALFVDSGGTSLYTLQADFFLPPDFLTDAGFVAHRVDGYVALEFHNTRYADALYFLDVCQDCVDVLSSIDVNEDLMAILRTSAQGEWDTSQINTDVRVPFLFSLDAGRASVNGGIGRFDWTTSAESSLFDEVQIAGQQLAREPVGSAVRRLTFHWPDADTLQELDNDIGQPLSDAMQALDQAERRLLNDGFFLFETLALLRTAKADSPAEWKQFMESISSEELVKANRVPWERYTESVCAVAPERSECVN